MDRKTRPLHKAHQKTNVTKLFREDFKINIDLLAKDSLKDSAQSTKLLLKIMLFKQNLSVRILQQNHNLSLPVRVQHRLRPAEAHKLTQKTEHHPPEHFRQRVII